MSYNHAEHCEPIQKAYKKVLQNEEELLTEATLTRKHFIALAGFLKRAKTLDELKELILSWAASSNPQFDEDRFRTAAGM